MIHVLSTFFRDSQLLFEDLDLFFRHVFQSYLAECNRFILFFHEAEHLIVFWRDASWMYGYRSKEIHSGLLTSELFELN